MRAISLIENNIVFTFTYDKEIIQSLKDLEAKYNPTDKTWILPNDSFYYIDIEDIIQKYNFTLKHSILKISRFKEILYPIGVEDKVNTFLSKYDVLNSDKQGLNKLYKFTPRDYQWPAAMMMLKERRVLCGDDMGVGKSIESLMAVEIGDLYPCLIVCPASVKLNWAKYIIKWMYRTHSVIEGKKSDSYLEDFIIINYDKLGKKSGKKVIPNEFLMNRQWGSIIVDESHNCQNGKTQRSKALKQILKNIEYRFFLSGTAVTIRTINLYNQLALLNQEHIVGGWKNFVDRYCGAHQTMFGLDTSGATNLGELNLKLRTSCYIRREKRDVLEDLPEIQTTILDIEINNKREYKKAENEFIDFLKERYPTKETLKKLKAETIVQLGILKRVAALGKLKDTFEWIDDILACGNKLVVFTCTNDVINAISERYECNKITGSVNIKKRQEYIDDFIENEETRILPLNIKAGGTGIDGLQEVCSTVLIVEWPDIPGLIDQAISRIDRSGQLHGMNAYHTQAKDTIEEKLYEDLLNKRVITDAINKGKAVQVDDSLIEGIFDYYLK